MEGNHGAYSSNHSSRGALGTVANGTTAHGALHGPDPNTLLNQFNSMSLHPMGMPINPPGMPVGPAGPWLSSIVDAMHAPGVHAMQQNMAMAHPENSYPHLQGPGYAGGYFGLQMPMHHLMPFTPGRANIPQPRVERGQPDVPDLENRRGSYSTTESTPATPFWAGVSHRENGPRVASLDRSTYTTPSPQQLGMASLRMDGPKSATTVVPDATLDGLLKKHPPIPKAVPAVFTPPGQMKSLEQSLENRIPGNRNVYIRGLHPTTDDQLLYDFAARFGPVETSKAIIDTGTGACKGFGFAKFFHVRDSEACIQGFHRLGYEVGFARESFNSRLKAQGDEGSTNLYISNLPKSLTEVELGAIFLGYNILSSKILRDSMGNSRGVGFARFESRDVCDEIIGKFNGVGIGEEGLLMNIRYADTPAQKELKRVTAERRLFRTNEYNIGAYGTTLVGTSPTLYSQQSQWRRSAGPSRSDESGATRDNGTSGSQPGDSQTATSASTEEATVSTPNSSECDEGVTLHVDPISGAVTNASAQSSPTAKKDSVKKELPKMETPKKANH